MSLLASYQSLHNIAAGNKHFQVTTIKVVKIEAVDFLLNYEID